MSKKREEGKGVSDQLKEAIRASGRSLRDLEAESGVTRGQLSRFLHGKRDLSLETAGKLFETLGLRLVSEPKKSRKEKK